MVVLNVIYHCKPGKRDTFLEAVMSESIDLTSRSENGNIKYDYYRSVDHEDELLLIEKWTDETTLAVHRNQPHFFALGDLKEEFVEGTDIEQFIVE